MAKHRRHSEKLVRQKIEKTRKYRSIELLYSQREEVNSNKLMLNVTYYPNFSKLKNILSRYMNKDEILKLK